MFSCQSCGNTFTRKYNLVRHQKHYCNESVQGNVSAHDAGSDGDDVSARDTESDRGYVSDHDAECDQEEEKSNNIGDLSSVELVTIITDLLKDQRRRWKKDLEKLYQALTAPKKREAMNLLLINNFSE